MASQEEADTGKNELKILVIGKTGVGKSALINALAGNEVSPESDMETGTYNVEEILAELSNGIKVTFYDTPGFHDAKGKEKEYLRQISALPKDIDLIVYCNKVTDKRMTEEDCDTLCEFTRVLGEDFWNNAVFALTFSNMVQPKTNITDPAMRKQALEEKLKLMSKKLREVLQSKAQLPSKITRNIPIVPVGYYSEEGQILANGSHWFTDFWCACMSRIKAAGRPAIIKGYVDRFDKEIEIQEQEQPPPYQYPMPPLTQPVYQAVVPAQGNQPINTRIRISYSLAMAITLIRAIGMIAAADGDFLGRLIQTFAEWGAATIERYLETMYEDLD